MTTQSKNDSNLGRQLFGLQVSVVENPNVEGGDLKDFKKPLTEQNTMTKNTESRPSLAV